MVMKNIYKVILLCCAALNASAQKDSLDLGDPAEKILIRNTFNGATVISAQSSNIADAGQLNVLISHRFGTVTEGAYNFFGLDAAVMRLGFEYGVADKLTAGLGRSTSGKNFDFYLKYRLLTQSKGLAKGKTPFTLTIFTSTAISTERVRMLQRITDKSEVVSNLTYTLQPIFSREFSRAISIQLSPTYVHRNQTDFIDLSHDIYALGIASKIKFGKRSNFILDYHYLSNKSDISTIRLYNPLGVGVEFVTGGHIFKLHATNSVGMIDKEFLLKTSDNFFKGDVRVGFTLIRSFAVKPEVKGGSLR
jgi:hypothetical protein